MGSYSKEELEEALHIVTSAISRCEKTQPKFVEGTSQHTLLKNRIKALYISKSLITGENVMDNYTKVELTEALPPLSSIISKCEKARQKFKEGTSHHPLQEYDKSDVCLKIIDYKGLRKRQQPVSREGKR